jgi:hypothetical protein
MGRKVYQHNIYTYFSTDVLVGGMRIPILFEGGTRNNPEKVKARYVTDNIGVQAEIEKRKDFGREITLIYTEPPARVVIIPEGFEEIKKISTGIEAKDYLLERFSEVRHAELKSIAMIKEVAAKNKIIFSDLF